jgi:CheY-like chemotaxis protein
VSRLKIDRSFVNEIDRPDAQVPIIDATVSMAFGLGLGVVAEGVETVEQLQYLRLLGCAHAQGYLLARPLRPEQIDEILAGHRPWSAVLPPGDEQPEATRPVDVLLDLALSSDGGLESLLHPLLEELRQLTGLESAYLTRLTPDGQDQVVQYSVTPRGSALAPGGVVAWETSLCKRALDRKIPRTSCAGEDFPDTAVPAELGIVSYAVEPVYDRVGALYGTLCVASGRPVELTEADSATLRLFARLVAEKLRVLATIEDELSSRRRPPSELAPQVADLAAVRRDAWRRWHDDGIAHLEHPATGWADAAASAGDVDAEVRVAGRLRAHEAFLAHRPLVTQPDPAAVGGPRRVLVADDDAVLCAIMASVIESQPDLLLVATARTGAEAIGMTVAEQPDLIVLDHDLGDIHADDVVLDVRQFSRGTRILLYSSHGTVHQIGARLGVDRSLHKLDGPQRLTDALLALAR